MGIQVTQLHYDGKNINTNKGMADAFNNFFTEVGSALDNDIPNSINLRDPNIYLSSRNSHSLFLAPTTSEEI